MQLGNIVKDKGVDLIVPCQVVYGGEMVGIFVYKRDLGDGYCLVLLPEKRVEENRSWL